MGPRPVAMAFIAVATAVAMLLVVGARNDATEILHAAENNNESINFPWNKIRLPGNVIPLKYCVYLHPNITDGKFQYTGEVKITMEIKESTDFIILHSVKITHLLTQVVDATSGDEIEVKGITKNEKHEQVAVHLGAILSAHKTYVLSIMFAADLQTELTMTGFYKSSYKTKTGERKFLATTQFEATGARLAFPCFDEPGMKANFSIVMVRERIHTTLSNMPLEKTVHRGDGLDVDVFRESVKMSSYLVAFIVSEFQSVTATTQRGVSVSVWTPRDQLSQAKYAVQVTPKILDFYEKFFDVEFPLPKLDLIGVPDSDSGAQENWGLITYRLTALLYDEEESTTADRQRVAVVIAHEVAHQWFGDLVTMKWWNDLWLNEGFASFVEYIGTDLVGPTWGMMDQFVTSNVHGALALDSHSQSRPISVSVKDPADIGALFDGITYLKGSSVIRMMRDFIGPNIFLKGLSSYLKKYKYGNADSNDLWDSLGKAVGPCPVGLTVKHVMATWTLQQGYPLIKVRRSGKYYYLTQERFVSDTKDDKNKTSSPRKPSWDIPVTFYYQHDRETKRRWFPRYSAYIILPYSPSLGWIKLNVDEVGFYRVKYETENSKALATQLNTDHTAFSLADRANLLDDAFQLANAGMKHTKALELTEYLTKERDYVPIQAALASLGNIGDLLLSRSGYIVYEKYIMKQLLPLIHKIGWIDQGTHLEKLLRDLVLRLAVRHNNGAAVKKAKERFRELMVKGKVPANLRPTVYFAGIRYGTEKEWNYLFHKYQECQYPSEKALLMDSLAETSDPKLLNNYLSMTLKDDVIKSQDSCHVIKTIALNPIGRKMTFDFMKENWTVLMKRYGDYFTELSEILGAVLGRGKTKDDLAEAEGFFATHDVGGMKLAANQTVASIRNRIKWLHDHERVVVDWLKSKV